MSFSHAIKKKDEKLKFDRIISTLEDVSFKQAASIAYSAKKNRNIKKITYRGT